MFPKSSKTQEYPNHYLKSIKFHQNHCKNTKSLKNIQSQRENDLSPKLVPTTLAVLGILSSCPRVMRMQCWKSQIPPPLSTRTQIVVIGFQHPDLHSLHTSPHISTLLDLHISTHPERPQIHRSTASTASTSVELQSSTDPQPP